VYDPTSDLIGAVDPARIREVVANLLTNALRHTPRDGSVELSAHLARDNVEVTVQDAGSGIPPDQLDPRQVQPRQGSPIADRRTSS